MIRLWERFETERKSFWTLFAVIILLLLPVFMIAAFSRPSADDFGYSLQTHAAVQAGGGAFAVLKAAWQSDLAMFQSWQGLYSSAFVLALQPAIFGSRYYGFTFVLMAAILFFCLLGLFCVLCRRGGMPGRYTPGVLALLFTYAFIQGMPNPVEGLFWYNGVMNYLPFFALALLNVGVAFNLMYTAGRLSRWGWAALSAALSFVISGGHHVAILLNLLLLLSLLVAALCGRRRLPVLGGLCLSLGAALVGLGINMTSPGTAVRLSGFHSASMPEAIVKSFLLTAMQYVRWLDLPFLCLLALLTPLLLRLWQARPLPALLARLPWLPAALTFVYCWAMIWLPSYTMGGIGPGRLINIVWMVWLLGMAASYAVVLGWLLLRKKAAPTAAGSLRRPAALGGALLLCMALIGSHTVKEGLDNHFATTTEALYELAQGTPQRYAAEWDAREAALADPGQTAVEISPVAAERPYLLFFSDISEKSGAWQLADYYGKTAVTVRDNPTS